MLREITWPPFYRRPTPFDVPERCLSLRVICTGPKCSYRWAPVTDISHSGRCSASISRISGPTSMSANCSLLRACRSQPLTAAAATIRTLGLLHVVQTTGSESTLQGMVAWKGRLSSCLMTWRCSDMKLYYKRWTHRAVCPFRYLKLSRQVKAEWSMHTWNSCTYIYLRKCSRVFTIASNSQRVTQ